MRRFHCVSDPLRPKYAPHPFLLSFLRILQTGLEKVIRNQVGFGGRFKEFLRATTIADQIVRYRNRINELRSNFLVCVSAALLRSN
jgi:hypothetical protein